MASDKPMVFFFVRGCLFLHRWLLQYNFDLRLKSVSDVSSKERQELMRYLPSMPRENH